VMSITRDDLAENQSGRISERQKTKLNAEKRYKLAFLALGIIATVGVVGYVIARLVMLLVTGGMGQVFSSSEIMVLAMLVIFAPIEYRLLRGFWRFSQDVSEGQVESVQGLAVVKSGASSASKLFIHDVQYNVSQKTILLIKHLEPHILHYLPRSKAVLSIEVVEKDT